MVDEDGNDAIARKRCDCSRRKARPENFYFRIMEPSSHPTTFKPLAPLFAQGKFDMMICFNTTNKTLLLFSVQTPGQQSAHRSNRHGGGANLSVRKAQMEACVMIGEGHFDQKTRFFVFLIRGPPA
jgi:hypothetical protein